MPVSLAFSARAMLCANFGSDDCNHSSHESTPVLGAVETAGGALLGGGNGEEASLITML